MAFEVPANMTLASAKNLIKSLGERIDVLESASNASTLTTARLYRSGLIFHGLTFPTLLYGIAYGAGLYVANANNRACTSTDGITWTLGKRFPTAFNGSSGAMGYGNGLFVAPSRSSGASNILVSPDGLNWFTRTNPLPGVSWQSVAYGNGTFVISVNGGAAGASECVITSTDGNTWTARTIPSFILSRKVVFANGFFWYCADTATPVLFKSADGISWSSVSLPGASRYQCLAYGNGTYVALSNAASTTCIATSPDGVTWTAQVGPLSSKSWSTVLFVNGVFIAAAATSGTDNIITSLDGVTWTARTAPVSDTWNDMVYGDNALVATGSSGFMGL